MYVTVHTRRLEKIRNAEEWFGFQRRGVLARATLPFWERAVQILPTGNFTPLKSRILTALVKGGVRVGPQGPSLPSRNFPFPIPKSHFS